MPKDNFSEQSADYQRYRPDYPAALYEAILAYVTRRQRVWDCATGNGQAAVPLAAWFEEVFASDISEKQLALAPRLLNIHYARADALNTPYADNFFDLVTVAQAYHWLAGEPFFHELNRVMRPGAILAVWCYGKIQCANDSLNALIGDFYARIVGPYWDPERRWIDEELRTIPFPFPEKPAPDHLYIERQWQPADLLGYLHSWSAVQHYIRDRKSDPVALITEKLRAAWPSGAALPFRFPLFVRLGQINKSR